MRTFCFLGGEGMLQNDFFLCFEISYDALKANSTCNKEHGQQYFQDSRCTRRLVITSSSSEENSLLPPSLPSLHHPKKRYGGECLGVLQWDDLRSLLLKAALNASTASSLHAVPHDAVPHSPAPPVANVSAHVPVPVSALQRAAELVHAAWRSVRAVASGGVALAPGECLLKRTLAELEAYEFPQQNNRLALVFDPLQEIEKFRTAFTFGVEVFEAGHVTPPHLHPHSHELFFILSGNGMAFCDGKTWEVRTSNPFLPVMCSVGACLLFRRGWLERPIRYCAALRCCVPDLSIHPRPPSFLPLLPRLGRPRRCGRLPSLLCARHQRGPRGPSLLPRAHAAAGRQGLRPARAQRAEDGTPREEGPLRPDRNHGWSVSFFFPFLGDVITVDF